MAVLLIAGIGGGGAYAAWRFMSNKDIAGSVQTGATQDKTVSNIGGNHAPPKSDLELLAELSDADLNGISTSLTAEFYTQTPLGRMYLKLKDEVLSPAERQRFVEWANQKRNNASAITNQEVLELLSDIGRVDDIFRYEPAQVESAKEERNLSLRPLVPDPRRAEARLIAALRILLDQGSLGVVLCGVLHSEDDGQADDKQPPPDLTPDDRQRWNRHLADLKFSKTPVAQIKTWLVLAELCRKARDETRAIRFAEQARALLRDKASSFERDVAENLRQQLLSFDLGGAKGSAAQAAVAAENAGKLARAADDKAMKATADASRAMVAVNQAATDAKDAADKVKSVGSAVVVTPQQLQLALGETAHALAGLDPAKLSNIEKARIDEFAARRMAADKLQAELLELANSEKLDEAQSMKARTQVQFLHAQAIALTVDFAAYRAVPGELNLELLRGYLNQIESSLQKTSRSAAAPEQIEELQKELSTLRASLDDSTRLSDQDRSALLINTQRMAHRAVALQIAGAFQQVATHKNLSRASLREFWNGLDLTSERVQDLKPPATASEAFMSAWNRLNDTYPKIVESLERLADLPPDQEAKLTAQIGLAAHALTLLLDSGGSGTSGGVGVPPDLRPLWTAVRQVSRELEPLRQLPNRVSVLENRIAELDARVRKLCDQEVLDIRALEPIERQLVELSHKSAGAESRVAKLEQELERFERSMVDRPTDEILAKSVEKTLAQLAKYGYGPPTHGRSDQTHVDPELPAPNSRLAKEFAANGYVEYYAGRPDQLKRAVEFFSAAIKYDPQRPEYRFFLALSLYRLGRVAEAEAQVLAGRDIERREPVLNPNRALERVQGPLRSWLETLRHSL